MLWGISARKNLATSAASEEYMLRNMLPALRRISLSAVVFAALLVSSADLLHSQGPALHVMPLPRSIEPGTGKLMLDDHFYASIAGKGDERLNGALDRFLARLDRQCGGIRRAQFTNGSGSAPILSVKVAGPGGAVQGLNEDESYKLSVTSTGVELSAATDVGAMHGFETFLQLVETSGAGCWLPAVTIDDAPRFQWRGYMLDVSRHFEPIPVIERTLDAMTIAKLNVFHWHLSDDQGFRAESKLYPKFTQLASDGMFYTQDEMRHIVAYARERGIRVVPEFDIPGHTSSWLLAYPEIGAGEDIKAMPQTFGIPQAELDPSNEKVYKFLDGFIGEMGAIFPDAYFHIGGDETKGKGWLENPRIKAFMDKQGFKTPEELQAYFNRRLLPILTKHGKKMMGWDEILQPSLPKDIMIQSWRGDKSLSDGATQGYTGILSAPYYLDAQKTNEVMFLADPIPADTKLTPEQQKLILGGEVCMWSEHIHEETIDSRVWPRTLAIAERFWSPQSDRDVADMYRRLRIASYELEDVGLTHISGPAKLRRSIAGGENKELDLYATVLEATSLGERYRQQHTDRLTSLNRLVDAVVADPPSREEIAAEVDAAVSADAAGSKLAVAKLKARFISWQAAAPEIASLAASRVRLNDQATRAAQFGALGTAGLEALEYLEVHAAPPAGWKEAKQALLDDAKKPSGMVKFDFLPAVQKLVEAAAAPAQ
jgi:hexosaminidase